MPNTKGRLAALIISVSIVGMSTSAIPGQQPVGTPEAPIDAATAECTTEPRSLDEVINLAERLEATPGNEYSIVFIADVPSGIPAATETVDAVTNTVRELTACIQLGEALQTYALYSDDFLGAIAGSSDSFIKMLRSTPVSDEPANQGVHVAAIQEVTLLDDDRVSAIVTIEGIEDSHPAPGRTFLMVFVHEDDRWLLDGQYERIWAGEPATPPVDVADLVDPQDDGTPAS